MDEVMVWGEALVEAHYLEDRLAIFPRVVLAEGTARYLLEDEELSVFVNQDFDGVYYLNYLSNWSYCGEVLAAGFERMKQEAMPDARFDVMQKLRWHMNYANRELERKGESARLSL